MMNFINIDKSLVPYEFNIQIKGETFNFKVNYNYLSDFFTVDLYKNNEVVVVGEKLVYGKPLFISSLHRDIPRYIIPLDLSGNTQRITYENFNEKVFLFIVEDENNAI